MLIHYGLTVGDDWPAVRSAMTRAFQAAHQAATAEESFVFVVHQDDLLGRRGPAGAMLACGLLSAARTAAIEGSRRGWSANVIAVGETFDRSKIEQIAEHLDAEGLTGETIRLGPSHLGKVVP